MQELDFGTTANGPAESVFTYVLNYLQVKRAGRGRWIFYTDYFNPYSDSVQRVWDVVYLVFEKTIL